jgi:hypothetical protein
MVAGIEMAPQLQGAVEAMYGSSNGIGACVEQQVRRLSMLRAAHASCLPSFRLLFSPLLF